MKKIQWQNDKRKLGDLVPWPRNPRQIRKDEAKRLSDSLQKFDQVETIAISPDNDIYNGHQRLNVWIEEYGPDFEVDVRISSRALTEKEREKLTVYLHKGAAGEWNFDILANEFEVEDLIDWGFSENELQIEGFDFGDDGDAPEAQIDKAEELQKKWQVERGQNWEIGSHRMMCGDSMNEVDVVWLTGGEDVAVVTDPPYGIAASSMVMGSGKKKQFTTSEWDKERIDILSAINIDDQAVIWGGNYYADMLPITGDWLCWYKKNDGLSFSEFELAWTNLDTNARIFQHHWGGEVKVHITQKPIEVMKWAIGFVDGIIYDPFLGSGTTMVAAEQLNRVCYGMEIEPKYCAVTLERISEIELQPKLVKHGQTYTTNKEGQR